MLLKDQKELKTAITELPVKEKDKLLLRLIAKDKVLTEHLHFKLLEDPSDLELRQQALEEEISAAIQALKLAAKVGSRESLVLLRRLNGRVNHHYKVTKDPQTDAELRLLLLELIPVDYNESVFSSLGKYNERLKTYFLRSVLALYKKYVKLHEDLQYDLNEKMNSILDKIVREKLHKTAAELGLPNQV